MAGHSIKPIRNEHALIDAIKDYKPPKPNYIPVLVAPDISTGGRFAIVLRGAAARSLNETWTKLAYDLYGKIHELGDWQNPISIWTFPIEALPWLADGTGSLMLNQEQASMISKEIGRTIPHILPGNETIVPIVKAKPRKKYTLRSKLPEVEFFDRTFRVRIDLPAPDEPVEDFILLLHNSLLADA